MEPVFKTIEDLNGRISICNDCCNGNYKSFHCPLCEVDHFKPTRRAAVIKHLFLSHWKTRIESTEGFHSVLCKLSHGRNQNSHYHCPSCYKTIRRKTDMRIHIHKCHAKSEKIVNSLKKDIKKEEKDVKIPICRIDCSVCGKSISKKWFKYHMVVHERKDISTDRHHFTVRIDSERGVFLSDKTLQGRYIPIHLIKKTSGTKHLFICEDLHCIDQKNIALRGGNTSFECAHMRSVPFAVPGKVLDLNINVLENLVASGFISDSRSKQMLKLKDVSESQHIPFVVEAPNPPHSSSRFINLSVFSGTQRYWSRLDRTVVYIDTLKQHVKCRCSKSSDYCTHKAIAKWFLKQERPEYFQSEKREISDIEIDSECDTRACSKIMKLFTLWHPMHRFA